MSKINISVKKLKTKTDDYIGYIRYGSTNLVCEIGELDDIIIKLNKCFIMLTSKYCFV